MATRLEPFSVLARFHHEVSKSGFKLAILRAADRALPVSIFQLYRAILVRHDLSEPLVPTGRNLGLAYRAGAAEDMDQLERFAGHSGRPLHWFRRGDRFLIAASDDGSVIGYENFASSGHAMRDAPMSVVPHGRQLFAVQVYVEPSHRGRMIAHDIIAAAQQGLSEAGYRWVYGLVVSTNRPARSAHAGRGFAPVHDVFCLRICGFTYPRWGRTKRFAFTGLRGRMIQRLPQDPSPDENGHPVVGQPVTSAAAMGDATLDGIRRPKAGSRSG